MRKAEQERGRSQGEYEFMQSPTEGGFSLIPQQMFGA